MGLKVQDGTPPSLLAVVFLFYSYLIQSHPRPLRASPTITWVHRPQPYLGRLVQSINGGISNMVSFFQSMVQFFGLLGVFKYIMDQDAINAVHQILALLNEVSKNHKGGPASLSDTELQKLITEVGNKVWTRVVSRPEVAPVEWWARQAVPEGLIWLVKWTSVPSATRERTRQLAVQGMWSFLLPACLAIISAHLFVQEVEFVKVASDEDYYYDAPDHSGHIVKRIMFGGGKLSFSIPYNPIILIVAQFLIGVTVFQSVSFLILLLSYQPFDKPVGPSP